MSTNFPKSKEKVAKRKALLVFIALEIWVLTVVLYILFIRKEVLDFSLVLRMIGSFLIPILLYIFSLYRAKKQSKSQDL